VKTCAAILAALAAIALTACGGGSTPSSPADQRLCAAAKALKEHPGFRNFLAVGKAGKNASTPLRNDVIKLAQAAFNGPQSAVTGAEQKLYSDCGL
jgi:hypothetical protein